MSPITVTPGHYVVTPAPDMATMYDDRMLSVPRIGLFSPVTVGSSVLFVMQRV